MIYTWKIHISCLLVSVQSLTSNSTHNRSLQQCCQVTKQIYFVTQLISIFFWYLLSTKQIFTHYFLLVTFSSKYLLSTLLLLLANMSLPKQKCAHFLSFVSKFCTASVFSTVFSWTNHGFQWISILKMSTDQYIATLSRHSSNTIIICLQ